MNQFVLQADRKFQTAHTTNSLSHSNTLCKSSSHSFKSNITLRTESHKIPNLNERKEEYNYKIKSPNTSKIVEANYQNQDSILVVDTNLRIYRIQFQ